MGYKNIFEILAEKSDVENDVSRIIRLSTKEDIIIVGIDYTLFDFVDYYCFDSWKSKGHCIDLKDFVQSVMPSKSNVSKEVYALRITELFYNIWKLADNYIISNNKNKNKRKIKYYSSYLLLEEIMISVLERLNHTAYYYEDEQKVLVVENKSEVTAAAEVVPEDMALDVVRYNHHLLKGDLSEKKSILLRFANDLEGKRKTLNQINSKLESNIFFILNNLNLRHNNCNEGDKKFNKSVAEMNDKQLENWYDELYQMILLAYLEVENVDRNIRVEELKKSITS